MRKIKDQFNHTLWPTNVIGASQKKGIILKTANRMCGFSILGIAYGLSAIIFILSRLGVTLAGVGEYFLEKGNQ